MGGKSGEQQQSPAAAPSGFAGPVYNMEMPMMPTQLQDIAAQLNRGYGGDHLTQLQKLYTPTRFSGYQNFPGMNTAPVEASAPATVVDAAAAQGSASAAPGNGLIYDQMIARMMNPSSFMGLGGGQY